MTCSCGIFPEVEAGLAISRSTSAMIVASYDMIGSNNTDYNLPDHGQECDTDRHEYNADA